MKIGFDAKRYFQNSTGLGNYSRWLVDGLASLNTLDIHLYHPNELSQKIELPIHQPSRFIKKVPSLWRTRFVCSRLESDGMHVFHGLSNELPFGIHKTTIKSIVTIHDLIHKRYPSYYSAIDKIIYNRKVYYAQKHADIIVTPSEQTKTDIIEFYDTDPAKIKVIPLSVSSKKIAIANKTTNKKYILCVSSFDKRKNLLNLVKAFESIPGNDFELVLAGKKGDTSDEIIQYLSQSKSQVKVIFNVPQKQLEELYTNSTFCVYPSEFEGFGIPILEAFSYGKTVATSNTSSMPEVGGEAAMYFDPLSTENIASVLQMLMRIEDRVPLVSRITKQLEKFDSLKLLRQYEDLYKSLAYDSVEP